MKGKNVERENTNAETDARVEYGFLRENFPFSIRLMRGFVRRESQRIFDEVGLLPGDASVMAILALNPGITQTRLCDALLLKKPQAAVILRGMADNGLIARKESSEDRRINTIRLTKKGEKMWERLRERIDEHNELILSPLSASERQSLNGIFAKIISGFETRSAPGETISIDAD